MIISEIKTLKETLFFACQKFEYSGPDDQTDDTSSEESNHYSDESNLCTELDEYDERNSKSSQEMCETSEDEID